MPATVRFDPEGGPITAEVSCDPNRDGSYSLTLWEAQTNERLERWWGNFINPQDDRYELPGNPPEHDDRLLEALVVVAVPPGVGPSQVSLTVHQDGDQLDEGDSCPAPPGSTTVCDLFVRLEAS